MNNPAFDLTTSSSSQLSSDKEIYFSLCTTFTADLVKEINALPVCYENGILEIMCQNEADVVLQHRLERITGVQVSLCPADQREIDTALARFHDQYDQLGGMSEEFKLEIVIDDGNSETYKDLTSHNENDGPIVKLINTVIIAALKKKVSDIHIECYEYSVKVKYRIDGVLYPATEDLDKSFHSALVSRLKVMAELDIAEKRVPQDGRFKLRVAKRDIDFRISVIPSLFGENVVVRVLDNFMANENDGNMSLEAMGMGHRQLSVFQKAIHEPHGMILITGPTGSGKTTTLYAALNAVNDGQNKIITIEDPVEYNLAGIMQIPVNTKKGLTFAKGLRSILRHDPDKILVGEIRDGETADIAIQSALTGHLVFSSIHANNAYDVLARLQNINANVHNCVSALNCIVSQRLVRLNCRKCIQQATYSIEFLATSGILDANQQPGFFKGSGCSECAYTGFTGRQMICEILLITDHIRRMIFNGSSISELMNKELLVGGEDLRSSALSLVINGKTSLEEANRVTFFE